MPKRIMHEFKMVEISGVDNPAQIHAKMSIMKRAGDPIETREALTKAIETIGTASDHDATKAYITARAQALGATDLLPNDWASKNVGTPDNGEDEMSAETEKKVGELSTQIADMTKKLEAAEKSATEAATLNTALADLTTQFETLKAAADPAKAQAAAEAKKKFDDAVEAEVTKRVKDELAKREEIAKNDETIEIDGKTVRKSQVDPAMFALVKSLNEKSELSDFTKRAETEIGHLKGETTAKARALRAISKLAKEDGETIIAMLKSGETAMVSSMKEIGGNSPIVGSAAEKLAKRAESWAVENKVEKSLAVAKFMETSEGQDLYNQAEAEKRKK